MKQSFELHICDTDWETRKPADLLMSSSVDAENYDAALKLAKAELKEMQKDNIQKKSKRKSSSERSTISLSLS